MLSPLYNNIGLKTQKHCNKPSNCKILFKGQKDRSRDTTSKIDILFDQTKFQLNLPKLFQISNFKYMGIRDISKGQEEIWWSNTTLWK